MLTTHRAGAVVVGALMILAFWASPAPVGAQEAPPRGDEYAEGDYGRVRHQINGLTIRRGALNHDAVADVNSPVFPGDAVVTDNEQRAEIELAGGSLVRIDRNSEVNFLALPSPYASFRDNTVLQVASGTLRLQVRLETDEEFRIDTPGASVYLLGDGDFRIEAGSDGITRVISRRGVAEVVGAGGSVLVRGGMRTAVVASGMPDPAEPFNTFGADGFDRWVAERDAVYRKDESYGVAYGTEAPGSDVYDSLPAEVQPYYNELSSSGSWSRTDEYGYVWSPSAVRSGWRPYYDGYWDYGPGGYFWVGSEPWGWAPYHYGRWVWVGGIGWCWTPGGVFGGAWVAWSWGSAYVGWGPLGYYNRPVYYGTYYYGYYDPHCWTFVGYGHFHHHGGHPHGGRYQHYRTAQEVGDDLAHHAVRTRPPDYSPQKLAESPDLRQKALTAALADTEAAVSPLDKKPGSHNTFTAAESRYRSTWIPGSSGGGVSPAAFSNAPLTIPTGQSAEPLGRPSGDAPARVDASKQFTTYPRKFRADTLPPAPNRMTSKPGDESATPGRGQYREGDPSFRRAPDYRSRPSRSDAGGRPLADPQDPRYRSAPLAPSPEKRETVAPPDSRTKPNSLGSRIRALFGSRDSKKKKATSGSSSSPSKPRSAPSSSRSSPSKPRPSSTSSRSSRPSPSGTKSSSRSSSGSSRKKR